MKNKSRILRIINNFFFVSQWKRKTCTFFGLFRFSAQLRQIFSLEIRVACRISGASSEIESCCSLYAFSRAATTTTTRVWYGREKGEEKKQSMEMEKNEDGKERKTSEEGDQESQCIVVRHVVGDRWTSDRWTQRGGMSHKIKKIRREGKKFRRMHSEIVPPLFFSTHLSLLIVSL